MQPSCPHCGKGFARKDNVIRHMRSTCPNKKDLLEPEGHSKNRLEITLKRKPENLDIPQHKVLCPECNEYIPQSWYRAHLRSIRHKTNACRFLEEVVSFSTVECLSKRLLTISSNKLSENSEEPFPNSGSEWVLEEESLSSKEVPVQTKLINWFSNIVFRKLSGKRNHKRLSKPVDIKSDIYSDTDDEEYFVPRNAVSEPEDELEIVNEEPFGMKPTNEITEAIEMGKKFISRSGLNWSTILKPATRA
ncbi:hypothetical protein FQA39_LY05814 [Lamprigera yunnana]|nr:hypothetical protein FQA39_LY05814 [Lamprigera yunnana]